VFDPEAGTWQIGPKLTPARGHFGMGLIDDTIVGAGGWVHPRHDDESAFPFFKRFQLRAE